MYSLAIYPPAVTASAPRTYGFLANAPNLPRGPLRNFPPGILPKRSSRNPPAPPPPPSNPPRSPPSSFLNPFSLMFINL